MTVNHASAAEASAVMLADKYAEKLDPTGWWISEKLDGVRAYWDGQDFYSRNGNGFPAPTWFKQGLPATPLDGELWAGRRQFRRCLSIVRNSSSAELWQYITYLVFDAPALAQPYEQRVAYIQKTVVPIEAPGRSEGGDAAGASSSVSSGASGCPYAAPVGTVRCEGREHLRRELAKVEAKGGEGLMLRQPGTLYEKKRSKTLLKVKSTHDEEAKVVGHEGGTGKNAFRCGALTLVTPDGRQFSCGSGLSDHDRLHPPAINSVVTYRFTELMENGYPRFPVFVGPRIDLSWDVVCKEYMKAPAESHKPGILKRQHSILYAPATVERQLSDRAEKGEAAEEASAALVDPHTSDEEEENEEAEAQKKAVTKLQALRRGNTQRLAMAAMAPCEAGGSGSATASACAAVGAAGAAGGTAAAVVGAGGAGAGVAGDFLAPSIVTRHHFCDAAKAHDWDQVKALVVSLPSLMNATPAGRWSALHQASGAGDVAMVKWLLAHGADKHKRNGAGQTAAEVASDSECAALLR